MNASGATLKVHKYYQHPENFCKSLLSHNWVMIFDSSYEDNHSSTKCTVYLYVCIYVCMYVYVSDKPVVFIF